VRFLTPLASQHENEMTREVKGKPVSRLMMTNCGNSEITDEQGWQNPDPNFFLGFGSVFFLGYNGF